MWEGGTLNLYLYQNIYDVSDGKSNVTGLLSLQLYFVTYHKADIKSRL